MLKDRRPTRSAWRRFAACGLVVGQNAIGELHPACTGTMRVSVGHATSGVAKGPRGFSEVAKGVRFEVGVEMV